MSYRGHVKNGVVLLDEPAQLPEGAAVCVELSSEAERSAVRGLNVREFAGMLADLSDAEWATYQRAARRRPLFES